MLTLNELLEDKTYREFFLTKPTLAAIPRTAEPWRVYIQTEVDGRWGRKDFWKYGEAFKFLKPRLYDIHDATIQSRGVAFQPPHRIVAITRGGKRVMVRAADGHLYPKTKIVPWKPKLPADEVPHEWCPYCRRPVIIAWFSKHHSFKGRVFDPGLRRCIICGASELLMRGIR